MIEPEFKRFLHSVVETLEQLGLTYGIGGSVNAGCGYQCGAAAGSGAGANASFSGTRVLRFPGCDF